MKIGDLVRFKNDDLEPLMHPARGIVVEIDIAPKRGRHQIAVLWNGTGWDAMDGKIGWNKPSEIEVIRENR